MSHPRRLSILTLLTLLPAIASAAAPAGIPAVTVSGAMERDMRYRWGSAGCRTLTWP